MPENLRVEVRAQATVNAAMRDGRISGTARSSASVSPSVAGFGWDRGVVDVSADGR